MEDVGVPWWMLGDGDGMGWGKCRVGWRWDWVLVICGIQVVRDGIGEYKSSGYVSGGYEN